MYSHLLHTIQLCQIPNPVLVKTPPLNLLFSFSAVVLLFQYVPKTQITKTFPFSYITAWFTNLADKRVKTCVSPTKYMGLSERILRQILTGKIMLHGLEHACQRQICRLFNLKSNICKNYIKEMEMWEWLEKLKNPSSLNDFFYLTTFYICLLERTLIMPHPMKLWNVVLPRNGELPVLTIQQMNPQSISEINTELLLCGGLVPCSCTS